MLDEVDRRILELLGKNARISLKELAAHANQCLPDPAVKNAFCALLQLANLRLLLVEAGS